jgi:hypothetical protein
VLSPGVFGREHRSECAIVRTDRSSHCQDGQITCELIHEQKTIRTDCRASWTSHSCAETIARLKQMSAAASEYTALTPGHRGPSPHRTRMQCTTSRVDSKRVVPQAWVHRSTIHISVPRHQPAGWLSEISSGRDRGIIGALGVYSWYNCRCMIVEMSWHGNCEEQVEGHEIESV